MAAPFFHDSGAPVPESPRSNPPLARIDFDAAAWGGSLLASRFCSTGFRRFRWCLKCECDRSGRDDPANQDRDESGSRISRSPSSESLRVQCYVTFAEIGPPAVVLRAKIEAVLAISPTSAAGNDSGLGASGTSAENAGSQAATVQPVLEAFASSHEAHSHCPARHPEPRARLFVTQPFEVAKDHRRSIPVRQSGDLVMKHQGHLSPADVVGRVDRRRRSSGRSSARSINRCRRDFCTLIFSAVRLATPWSQGPRRSGCAQRAGLACQHQERGLKRILGVVQVAERTAADGEDHRPVALDQHFKGALCGLVALRCESPKQLLVGPAR